MNKALQLVLLAPRKLLQTVLARWRSLRQLLLAFAVQIQDLLIPGDLLGVGLGGTLLRSLDPLLPQQYLYVVSQHLGAIHQATRRAGGEGQFFFTQTRDCPILRCSEAACG